MPKKIHIPSAEFFNNSTNEFIQIQGGDVVLEHSLFSVYTWESKWNKPFISKTPKTVEESKDYVRCMVIEGEVDPLAYYLIPDEVMQMIETYINAPMTATTFSKSNEPPSREIITAEILYWQMIVLGIPLEFEKRHLNQLLTLIKVCSIKSQQPKKMSKKEILKRNRELNAERKRRLNTKG